MSIYQHPVTPAALSQPLLDLCQQLVPGGEPPSYLDVIPEKGAPPEECFQLVSERVSVDGGRMVLGWALWELPTLFVEAEFHAVWQLPDGSQLDIAPKTRETKRILFLPDSNRKYDEHRVNNIRKALSLNPIVIEFLEIIDEEFQVVERGVPLGQAQFSLRGDDAMAYHRIQRQKTQVSLEMVQLYPKMWPYGPCWCGSGQKLKWCHRQPPP